MPTDSAPGTAAHFLDGLVECGFEHLFANLGTDHVALIEAMVDRRQHFMDLGPVGTDHVASIEAMAESDRRGRPVPRVILCPPERSRCTWRPAAPPSPGAGRA